MKEFYGKVSLAARVAFAVKEDDEEKATDVVFEDIEGLEIVLKDGSRVEITELEWDLVSEARQGNVKQSYIDDFEIYEED